ncbi:MAG: hypothetical protein KF878_05730 [Planctomycetes bacterium]|nr:hypothetical protein [Planctomycetota bacterium]
MPRRRPRPQPDGSPAATWTAPEQAGAFGGFIGPRNLVSLVQGTAPYLFDGSAPAFAAPPPTPPGRLDALAPGPLGWWSILRAADRLETAAEPTPEQLTDYFALCVAAHFATVATFVPTDVDTKIRAHLWWRRPPEELARQRRVALATAAWDITGVSARVVDVDPEVGRVSGHDGERLSILCGGALGHLAAGEADGLAELEAAIDAELARQAEAFARLARAPGRERDLLVAAASIVHNAGDVDQGLSASWGKPLLRAPAGARLRERFGRLAHEGPRRYGGAFARAATLYRELLASEGHRHYPLRETRLLRAHPALLLPVGPFFDDWGATLASWPPWSAPERAEALAAVVHGVRKVKGQEGYYRALAGFDRVRRLDASDLQPHLPSGVRAELKDPTLRKKVAVRRESFESSLFKRARALVGR